MADVPSWKRTLAEITANSDAPLPQPAHKKQKTKQNGHGPAASTTNGNGAIENHNPVVGESLQHEAMGRLITQFDAGLAGIEQTGCFSQETTDMVKELRKRLRREVSSAYTKALMENDRQPKQGHVISHTDVPAPLPAVKPSNVSVPGYKEFGNPDNGTKEWTLPPLPPITDLTLMTAPFTHTSSLPNWMPPTGTNSYEPLEFLGDAYLELFATRLIHHRFPHHNVGQKAGLRELLIKNETLSQYARDYQLGQKVKMAASEREQTGKTWQKVLADVFEAYVACIVLSDHQSGFTVAEEWLHQLWEPKVQEWLTRGEGKNTSEDHINMDVKSELQRFLVSKGVKLEYLEDKPMELDKTTNKTTFHMAVFLTGWGYQKVKLGTGCGRSKQLAGAEAAKEAFTRSKTILEDAHQKKLEFDRVHSKRRLASLSAMGMRPA